MPTATGPEPERARRRERGSLAPNSRVIIEQARGVTAQYGGLHPTAAFERLRRYARSHNVKPAELARWVVDKDLGFAEILRSGQPPHPPQCILNPTPRPGGNRAGTRYACDAAPDLGGVIVVLCSRGVDAVTSRDHVAPASDAAAREIIAAAASLGGEAGLKDLAADLVVALSAMIKKEAAMQGRSAIEVLDELFPD